MERRGDYRLRLVSAVVIERDARAFAIRHQDLYGVPKAADTEGLYGLLYYQRTSPKLDMHVVFPGFWHVHERDDHGDPRTTSWSPVPSSTVRRRGRTTTG